MVHEPQDAIGHERPAVVCLGVEEPCVGAVHHDTDALRRDPSLDRELSQWLVDGDEVVGDRCGQPGRARHERKERPKHPVLKAVAEELRHVLVKVEQQGHAGELLRKGGEGEKVRDGGHLDQRIPPPPLLEGQAPGDHGTEGDVLRHVAGEADERAIHRQADDAPPALGLLGGFAGLAKADDIHLVPGLDEGITLAANPRVAGIHGVDCDRHPRWRRVHPALTSSHNTSFSASESAARSIPRSAASASTRR